VREEVRKKIFFDVFDVLPRGGPGGNDFTARAYGMLDPLPPEPVILDIGAGPGIQTAELARLSGGRVVGLDNHPPFCRRLKKRADSPDRPAISVVRGSMFEPCFRSGSFDVIWAEGSIYIMGLEAGLRAWKDMLAPSGYFTVTELSWIRENPPAELTGFWIDEGAVVRTVNENLTIIEESDYDMIGHFTLPDSAWWDDFYSPMEERIETLKERYENDGEALNVLDAIARETRIRRDYGDWYGYVFYVMKQR